MQPLRTARVQTRTRRLLMRPPTQRRRRITRRTTQSPRFQKASPSTTSRFAFRSPHPRAASASMRCGRAVRRARRGGRQPSALAGRCAPASAPGPSLSPPSPWAPQGAPLLSSRRPFPPTVRLLWLTPSKRGRNSGPGAGRFRCTCASAAWTRGRLFPLAALSNFSLSSLCLWGT